MKSIKQSLLDEGWTLEEIQSYVSRHQNKLSDYLEKAFQEEIDKEIIKSISLTEKDK